ncbi:MAG: hypothetical protein IJL15_04850 [Clostridia bacterium]|nr:hypothetical protein [Clostridia bacterium]
MKKRVILFLLVAAAAIGLAYSTIAASGTEDDPLISLSYLNKVFLPQISSMIDQKLEGGNSSGSPGQTVDEAQLQALVKEEVAKAVDNLDLPSAPSTASSGGDVSYKAIQLFEGQTLVGADGGVEVLLRRGTFRCVDPVGDKITNVTKGSEAGDGNELTLQNLYLIPRSDGRGIVCVSSEGWVMVRGGYTVK